MIGLAVALLRYSWHKRVKKCQTRALIFQGRYSRIECATCGLHFWQAPGLFSGRR